MQTETLAYELDQRITRLWHLLLRRSFRELSRTSASVLARLRDEGPRRVTALASSEAIAQPTMTTLIGRLERDGLAVRQADPDDGRAVLVAITDEGLELLERSRQKRRAIVERQLELLDDDERAALAAALPALGKLTQFEEVTA